MAPACRRQLSLLRLSGVGVPCQTIAQFPSVQFGLGKPFLIEVVEYSRFPSTNSATVEMDGADKRTGPAERAAVPASSQIRNETRCLEIATLTIMNA